LSTSAGADDLVCRGNKGRISLLPVTLGHG
jgi:hypothetical protein